jgi:hypothetical protein
LLKSRQVDVKYRAAARRVGETHFAAKAADNLLDDTQSQAGAAGFPGVSSIGLSKSLEDARLELGRNAANDALRVLSFLRAYPNSCRRDWNHLNFSRDGLLKGSERHRLRTISARTKLPRSGREQ